MVKKGLRLPEKRSRGENIRKARELRGWTQGQLAEKADLSRNEVSLIENDKVNPEAPTMWRIADALGADMEDLDARYGSSRPLHVGPPRAEDVRRVIAALDPKEFPDDLKRKFLSDLDVYVELARTREKAPEAKVPTERKPD